MISKLFSDFELLEADAKIADGMRLIHVERDENYDVTYTYFLVSKSMGNGIFLRLKHGEEILWYHATLKPLPIAIAIELDLTFRRKYPPED